MTINQILYAVKLSEYNNFTVAATELFITQSSLSLQIKKLEEELGVELFIRDKNGLRLTDAGENFVYYGKKVLEDFDNLQQDMGNYSELLKGELRIGLLWTFGSTSIGEFIRRFMDMHPNIKVSFLFDGSANLQRKLNQHELDIVFAIENPNEPTDENIDIELVDESTIVLAVNKGHRLARKSYIDVNDLADENVMMVSKYSNLYPELFNNLNLHNTSINIIGYTSIADICYQVAEYGFGMSIMSLTSFNKINAGSDKVVAVPLRPAVKRNIYMVSLKNSMNNKIIKTFKSLLLSSERLKA